MGKKKVIIIDYNQFKEMKDKMISVLATLEDIRDGRSVPLEYLIEEVKEALKLATGKVEIVGFNPQQEILKIPEKLRSEKL